MADPCPATANPAFIWHGGLRLHQLHRPELPVPPVGIIVPPCPIIHSNRIGLEPDLPLTRLFTFCFRSSRNVFDLLCYIARSYILNRVTISYYTYSSVTAVDHRNLAVACDKNLKIDNSSVLHHASHSQGRDFGSWPSVFAVASLEVLLRSHHRM